MMGYANAKPNFKNRLSLEVYGRYVRRHLKSELAVDQLQPIDGLRSKDISCDKTSYSDAFIKT